MGVANTLPNYKSFTFDGTNSRAYGVYITGCDVFNAPERNVEMVEIPGRNGAYALDKGNFNNIEVTYPAGIFADTEADFAQAVSDLRNFLCSKSGYCRLEDDYNSGEYRMAIYKSGLEVDHDMLTAGEFNIVFECKPQRWLTSGETAVSVASGGKVTNPTLFDAKPQLQVWGYGDIDIGGVSINVDGSAPIGKIYVSNSIYEHRIFSKSIVIDDSYAISGDEISCSFLSCNNSLVVDSGTITGASAVGTNAKGAYVIPSSSNVTYSLAMGFGAYEALQSFNYGTSATKTASMTITISTSAYGDLTATISSSVAYDGVKTFTYTTTETLPTHITDFPDTYAILIDVYEFKLDSSYYALGNPLYIDLDIGEAWNSDGGTPVSVNNAVTIPAELPVLPPGDTTITYDNTITQFKVLPRWWKV